MKHAKIFTILILGALTLAQCDFFDQSEEVVDEDTKLEPMVIEKVDIKADASIMDEAYNTHLVLKIHRLVRMDLEDGYTQFELLTEIPLYSQRSGAYASVYGEGETEAQARAEIGGGQGVSEGKWKLFHRVYGSIQPHPDCGMELIIDEETQIPAHSPNA